MILPYMEEEGVKLDDDSSEELSDSNDSHQEAPEADNKPVSPTEVKPSHQKMHMNDVPPEDLAAPNGSNQEASNVDNKPGSPTERKPSSLQKIHADDVLSEDLADSKHSRQEIHEADNKPSFPTEWKPSSPQKMHVDDVSKDLEDSSGSHQEASEAGSKPSFPIEGKPSPQKTYIDRVSKDLTDSNHSEEMTDEDNESGSSTIVNSLSQKILVDDISTYLDYSNISRQELPETDKSGSSTEVKLSFEEIRLNDLSKDLAGSNRILQEMKPLPKSSETVPKSCTDMNIDLAVYSPNVPVIVKCSQNNSQTKMKLSENKSSEKCVVSKENSAISCVKSPQSKPLPKYIGSNEPFQVPSGYLGSRAVSKSSNVPSDLTSLKSRLTLSEAISKAPCMPVFPDIDISASFLPTMNLTELANLLNRSWKPPIPVNKGCDKTLKVFLTILDEWARKGLDESLNPSINDFADITDHIETDLLHGLSVMKQMTTRLYSLVNAANKLPLPDVIEAHEFHRVSYQFRDYVNISGIAIWNSINNIESRLIQDLTVLKIISDSTSKLSNEDFKDLEEALNPHNMMTRLYTTVISSLMSLRVEMETFHYNIREYCIILDVLFVNSV